MAGISSYFQNAAAAAKNLMKKKKNTKNTEKPSSTEIKPSENYSKLSSKESFSQQSQLNIQSAEVHSDTSSEANAVELPESNNKASHIELKIENSTLSKTDNVAHKPGIENEQPKDRRQRTELSNTPHKNRRKPSNPTQEKKTSPPKTQQEPETRIQKRTHEGITGKRREHADKRVQSKKTENQQSKKPDIKDSGLKF